MYSIFNSFFEGITLHQSQLGKGTQLKFELSIHPTHSGKLQLKKKYGNEYGILFEMQVTHPPSPPAQQRKIIKNLELNVSRNINHP